MTVSEQQSETGRFEASPVVTVGCFGHQLSITEAQIVTRGMLDRIKTLLLPSDGWNWEDYPDKSGLVIAALCWPGDPVPAGFVDRMDSGLYAAFLQPSHRVGLTNDLNDAKYLVAEAIRVRRAGQNVEDPPGV